MKRQPKEFIPTSTNVQPIVCSSSWSQLAKSEQLYAYYISKAAWEGSKVCYFQRSFESPALFVLFQLIYSQDMESLKASALAAGVSDDEWRQMLAYTAAVFQNCGNYKSFGDTKFVPELDPEAFKKIARASEHYAIQKDTIDTILAEIENVIYNEEEPFARIGFRDENNGTTSYYSSDITKEEAKEIDEWCQ